MKKKFLALLLCVMTVISVVGCGKKKDDADEAAVDNGVKPQEEIVKLINKDLPSVKADRDTAVDIYNAYFVEGANMDSETWRKQLEEEALVAYDSYLEKLSAFSYENSDVQNLFDLYRKSAESQREAIATVVMGIGDVDTAKLTEGQQSINDSKTYMTMYQDELERLCNQYGITINGSFQSFDMSDATASDASDSDAE